MAEEVQKLADDWQLTGWQALDVKRDALRYSVSELFGSLLRGAIFLQGRLG